MSAGELAAYIDHSVLKPEFTQEEIRKHIQEGIDYGCKTVCINPASIPIAREMCRGTGTGICTVCDFPFGTSTTRSKVLQAEEYCKSGDILELDVVAKACHRYGTEVKVIFETDALTLDEVRKATVAAGADFVKTSTGFFTGGRNEGATVETVRAMMDASKGQVKIKGSGGIRNREHFFRLIDMGIDRMGIGYRSTPVVLGVHPDKLEGKGLY